MASKEKIMQQLYRNVFLKLFRRKWWSRRKTNEPRVIINPFLFHLPKISWLYHLPSAALPTPVQARSPLTWAAIVVPTWSSCTSSPQPVEWGFLQYVWWEKKLFRAQQLSCDTARCEAALWPGRSPARCSAPLCAGLRWPALACSSLLQGDGCFSSPGGRSHPSSVERESVLPQWSVWKMHSWRPLFSDFWLSSLAYPLELTNLHTAAFRLDTTGDPVGLLKFTLWLCPPPSKLGFCSLILYLH